MGFSTFGMGRGEDGERGFSAGQEDGMLSGVCVGEDIEQCGRGLRPNVRLATHRIVLSLVLCPIELHTVVGAT